MAGKTARMAGKPPPDTGAGRPAGSPLCHTSAAFHNFITLLVVNPTLIRHKAAPFLPEDDMRLLPITTALTVAGLSAATLFSATVSAAPAPAPKPALRQAPPAGNPVVATVNGDPIRMSDVAAAAQQLPPNVAQQVPPQVLFPKLIDQLVSRRALLIQARKQGLEKDPAVQKQMQAAADQVLQGIALQRAVLPKVTEDAIKAAYDKQYAGKPGEPEIHARHILVDTEAKAKDIIAQLEKGAKFEDLAKKYGDPKDAATQNGGDLGFFKKGDMLPEFSTAAFALKPNEYTHTPVHTRYGWHVIQVLETRTSQPPTYDQVHDEIKQQVLQADVAAAVAAAKAGVKVQLFNANGTPVPPGGTPSLPLPPTPPAAKPAPAAK
jgi:peptidyl-prolyl cis-trans isomerase C